MTDTTDIRHQWTVFHEARAPAFSFFGGRMDPCSRILLYVSLFCRKPMEGMMAVEEEPCMFLLLETGGSFRKRSD
jgi:hypothetical protein